VVTLVLVVGGLCFMIGWVWLIVAGFVESFPWGIGTFFFWPIGLVFSILNWPEYKVPTYLMAGGFLLVVAGEVVG
jgi:hypothetical protein